MSFFEFPHTRNYDTDLGWLIKHVGENIESLATLQAWAGEHKEEYAELNEKVEGLINSLVDVIEPWDSSVAYHIYSLVSWEGQNYIALKDVPVGTMITNTEYWQPANTVIQQINAIGQTVTDLSEATAESLEKINTKIESIKFWYYPEDFGAVGDGVTDDTEAFQTMFNTVPNGATILLKANAYKVHNGITVNKSFLKIVGQFGRDEYGPGFVIDTAEGVFMTINGPGFGFYHVAFSANERNNNQTFLLFDADNETWNGNIDAIIENCTFLRAGKGIVTKGRNVRVYDCLLSTCFHCFYIEEPTNITTDVRGFDIVNNRFHSCIICLENRSTNLQTPKNIFFSSNFIDMGDILFRGNGGGLVFSNNYMDKERGANDQTFSVTGNPSGQHDVISGNTFKGVASSAHSDLANIQSPTIISGNTFINFAGGILLTAEASVIGNTLINVAEGVQGEYPIVFGAAARGVCAGNVVKSSKNITAAAGSAVQVENNYYIR